MRNEFDFDDIKSVEFCICVDERPHPQSYQIPTDRKVQEALSLMLMTTIDELGAGGAGLQTFELSEKYAPRESSVASLKSPVMKKIIDLYNDEGWVSNPAVLSSPEKIIYYFAVFRDGQGRKLVAVKRATQFKGVVKGRFIKLMKDSVTMMEDRIFKLDHDFDFLIAASNAYILQAVGFEHIAELEAIVSQEAKKIALGLEKTLTFIDFASVANFVECHKRGARLVSALSARNDLGRIDRQQLIRAAKDTNIVLEKAGKKISPAAGSEMGFLELLDDRRYVTKIKTGPSEAYVASSRRRI